MLAVALGARPHLNHNHRPAPRRSAPHVSEHAPGEEPPCAVKMGTRPDVTLAPLFLFSRNLSDCLSVCLSVYVCPSLQDVPAPAGERTKLGLTARLPLLLAAVCILLARSARSVQEWGTHCDLAQTAVKACSTRATAAAKGRDGPVFSRAGRFPMQSLPLPAPRSS